MQTGTGGAGLVRATGRVRITGDISYLPEISDGGPSITMFGLSVELR